MVDPNVLLLGHFIWFHGGRCARTCGPTFLRSLWHCGTSLFLLLFRKVWSNVKRTCRYCLLLLPPPTFFLCISCLNSRVRRSIMRCLVLADPFAFLFSLFCTYFSAVFNLTNCVLSFFFGSIRCLAQLQWDLRHRLYVSQRCFCFRCVGLVLSFSQFQVCFWRFFTRCLSCFFVRLLVGKHTDRCPLRAKLFPYEC